MTQAETNGVPVARLIGFEAKEIADGRAVVTLATGRQHANPMACVLVRTCRSAGEIVFRFLRCSGVLSGRCIVRTR